jgi:hypothetical protein
MLKIDSVDHSELREFTKEESEEMILVWEKITRIASDRSIALAEAYGKLKESDPEWAFLSKRMGDCIQNWAQKVRRLGGKPHMMWTVVWNEEGRERIWRLDQASSAIKNDLN